jgi:predicted metal-dependent peptidase
MSSQTDRSNRVELLLNHEPKAPIEAIEGAAQAIKHARMLNAASNAVIESIILGTCRYIPTTAIDTMAVTVAGDGLPLFLYNPEYVLKLQDGSPHGVQFVVIHEGGHLLKRHLQTSILGRDAQVWQLATECSLNDWVQRQLAATSATDAASRKAARAPMPRIKNADGQLEEQGINPDAIYKKYREDLRGQTPPKDPVSYEDFVKTDEACYRELMRMAKPPVNKNKTSGCQHQPGEAGGDPSDLPMDEEAVDAIVGEALDAALKSALEGDERAKRELLDLEGHSEGEKAEKAIGRLGLGALRGEKIVAREVNYWSQYLMRKMASLLEEDQRLQVLNRLVAVDVVYERDPQVGFRGDKPLKKGLLLCDTSGSMGSRAVKWFTDKCGHEPGLVLDLWAVDTQMYPIQFGEEVKGGGGTDFDAVVDYVRDLKDPYDFVVLYTDGYVSPFHPHEPWKWCVLLTADGNDQLPDQMPEVEFIKLDDEASSTSN